jgi:hypothetical protein
VLYSSHLKDSLLKIWRIILRVNKSKQKIHPDARIRGSFLDDCRIGNEVRDMSHKSREGAARLLQKFGLIDMAQEWLVEG